MRRKQCEIKNPEVVDEILKRATVGRLASLGVDGYPYITPVNYVWWNGSIYFHCAHEGEKIENIRNNNKVCFEVDIPLSYLGIEYAGNQNACQVHQFYHSVIIRGRAELVEEITEKVASLNALVAAHEKGVKFEQVNEENKAVGGCSVIAVRVDTISGKSDLAQKKSEEEKNAIANYLLKRNLPGDKEAARLMGE